MTEAEIVRRLESQSFPVDDPAFDARQLLTIAREGPAGSRATFNACQLVLNRDPHLLDDLGPARVAETSATALAGKWVSLNLWGFLGAGDLGPAGDHVVACGRAAIPFFAPLLDDKSGAGVYSGSKEVKVGAPDLPRVCDFTAFLLARICGVPYNFDRDDLARRDAEVERIRGEARHYAGSIRTSPHPPSA